MDRVTLDTVSLDDFWDLVVMMDALKHEMEPDTATNDVNLYRNYMVNRIKSAYIYHIPKCGFVMLDSLQDILLKDAAKNYWIMQHIYVVPEKRKGTTYARLLNTVIEKHEGQIIGLTFKQSDHNAVLQKRYKVLGTIYGRYD